MSVNLSEINARKTRVTGRVEQLLRDRDGLRPIWIRSPKSGPEFYTGFSRSKLYQEAAKGNIRSVSIREPGQVKGTRLFELNSILAFIEQCERAAMAETVIERRETEAEHEAS